MRTMRPLGATIPLADALTLIEQAATPIARTERVHLAEAHGRVIAESIAAAADVPPFARAAMDGFAVVADDTAGAARDRPATLRCVGTVHTGRAPSRGIGAGECMQIATGAPLPAGATAVVMVEETERSVSNEVRVMAAVSGGQNVAPRGSDMPAGTHVLNPGDLLNPSRVGALAAVGAVDADVYARPVVAVLSTGDELVEPGRTLGPAQTYDINRYTLSAIVSTHGGVPQAHATTVDSVEDIAGALERAASADIIVFSGGSSVGEKDLLVDVLHSTGEVLFHGIAIKPGKPTILARAYGKPVLGMPGNPTSCLSNAYLLLTPLLRRTARLPGYTPRELAMPLARRVVSASGRHQFYTVRIEDGAAVPAFKASGAITSMSHADGYFEIPAETRVIEAGEIVTVKLF